MTTDIVIVAAARTGVGKVTAFCSQRRPSISKVGVTEMLCSGRQVA